MANLTRCIQALYCEPWLIRPEMHARLCEILHAHVTGAAHELGGIEASFRAADPNRQDDVNEVTTVEGVAILDVGGVVGHRYSQFLNSSGVTSADVLARLVSEAAADESVEGIVLQINSPGGTVTGTPEAANAVRAAAQEKPVVSYADGLMASAAYWIGVHAEQIIASPSADVGSIGVYLALLDESLAYANEGYTVELFKRGKYKAMGMPGTTLTDEQRAHLQEGVDEIYDWFTREVSLAREVAPEAMEGQTFLAKSAVEVGLVDSVGTIRDAIDYVHQAAA